MRQQQGAQVIYIAERAEPMEGKTSSHVGYFLYKQEAIDAVKDGVDMGLNPTGRVYEVETGKRKNQRRVWPEKLTF